MDSSAHRPVASFGANDLEIVGFNGVPLVECGRALPIVRRKSLDRFFKLSVRNGEMPTPECHRQQLEMLAKEGRLTLLESPLPFPAGLRDDSGRVVRQPMVLCISQSFLNTTGCYRLEQHNGELLAWQQLQDGETSFWVTCASETAVEHLLNSWASQLLPQSDDLLAQGRTKWERALLLADLGLCAAVDRTLRWRLWVRYGAALAWSPEPERVRRSFDRLMRPEFPTCSWEDFIREYGSLCQTLCVRGPQPVFGVPVRSRTGVPREVSSQPDLNDWAKSEPSLLPLNPSRRAARNGV